MVKKCSPFISPHVWGGCMYARQCGHTQVLHSCMYMYVSNAVCAGMLKRHVTINISMICLGTQAAINHTFI